MSVRRSVECMVVAEVKMLDIGIVQTAGFAPVKNWNHYRVIYWLLASLPSFPLPDLLYRYSIWFRDICLLYMVSHPGKVSFSCGKYSHMAQNRRG